jgi:hypothetical protein
MWIIRSLKRDYPIILVDKTFGWSNTVLLAEISLCQID